MDDLPPLNTTTGTYVGGTAKVIGKGSPTAIVQNAQGTNNEFVVLVTSTEYFSNSVLIGSAISAANISDMTGTALVADAPVFAVADYGSIWGLYMFKKEETSANAIGAQTPDSLIVVGTKKGKGLAARFTGAIGSNVFTISAL